MDVPAQVSVTRPPHWPWPVWRPALAYPLVRVWPLQSGYATVPSAMALPHVRTCSGPVRYYKTSPKTVGQAHRC